MDEYYRILKDHGVTCSRDEILQIIQIADKDHDGYKIILLLPNFIVTIKINCIFDSIDD